MPAVKETLKWGFLNYGWPVARLMLAARRGMSLSKFSAAHLRPGDVVLDIGAHEGRTASVFSCCVGQDGAVHAIEPNPALHPALEHARTRCRWNNISVHHLAISNVVGELEFFTDTRPIAVASSLNPDHVKREREVHGATFESIRVLATTLDGFCAGHHIHPGFVKIDVEGAEQDVIAGGRGTLEKHRPVVWFECWCGNDHGQPVNKRLAHLQLLRDLGYRLFVATVIEKNGHFVMQEDADNVRDLQPLTDEVLNGPPIGIDVVALPH